MCLVAFYLHTRRFYQKLGKLKASGPGTIYIFRARSNSTHCAKQHFTSTSTTHTVPSHNPPACNGTHCAKPHSPQLATTEHQQHRLCQAAPPLHTISTHRAEPHLLPLSPAAHQQHTPTKPHPYNTRCAKPHSLPLDTTAHQQHALCPATFHLHPNNTHCAEPHSLPLSPAAHQQHALC
jgi:hypothetical protein